jgi:uncharacterized protein
MVTTLGKSPVLFEVTGVDRAFYAERLAGFLPPTLIDAHTHVWLKSFIGAAETETRTARWPNLVAEDNAIEDLLETYRLLLPKQQVTPLIFGSPRREVNLEATNAYVSRAARKYDLPALLVSTPAWSADTLEDHVQEGRFLGLKPYLSFAPPEIPGSDITVYDFLPRTHLEVADAHGWVIMLHLPRTDRLRDPVNLAHLLEIERDYPNANVIVAHIGRAYCHEDAGDAFDVLATTSRMTFDFSANTNAWVIEQALRAFGPQRVLFGSDLPILRMRMRRICEGGHYINLVPPGLYGDVSDDPSMREVSEEEGRRLSFFLYEELWAFRQAADAVGLTPTEVEDVFYNNAARVLSLARRPMPGHRNFEERYG